MLYTIVVKSLTQSAAGLTLNEFNATGGNQVNNYSWETNYLGVQVIFKYKIIGGSRSAFGFWLLA